MVYQVRWGRGTVRRRTMATASPLWECLVSVYYHLLKDFNWCPLMKSCHRRSDLLCTGLFPSSIKLNAFSYRLLSIITSQMPNLLPSPLATFHTLWPSAAHGWGSLFSMSGGVSSWAPVTGVTGTDGLFGGCDECDDRDWLFLVKYGQETVHPVCSAGTRDSLASQCSNMAAGKGDLISQPRISPLSSAQDFCTKAFTTQLFSLDVPGPRTPLSLTMTQSNLQLMASH